MMDTLAMMPVIQRVIYTAYTARLTREENGGFNRGSAASYEPGGSLAP
jgi:hypothetical protein